MKQNENLEDSSTSFDHELDKRLTDIVQKKKEVVQKIKYSEFSPNKVDLQKKVKTVEIDTETKEIGDEIDKKMQEFE